MSKPMYYELLTLEEQYFLCNNYQQALLLAKIKKQYSSIDKISKSLDLKIRNQVNEAYNAVRVTRKFNPHTAAVIVDFLGTTTQTYRNAIIRDRNAQTKITD